MSKEELKFYRDLGFSIIPCKKGTKIPLVKWKEYQKRKPKEEEIEEWFKDKENNIAIITGEVSGNLVVIDFDDSEVAKRFFKTPEFQNTLCTITGKGFHFYFRSSEPIRCFNVPELGINVKGEGGYVLAPLSLHPSGIKYCFLKKTEPLSIKNFEEWFWKLIKEKTGYEPPKLIEEKSFGILTGEESVFKGPHPPHVSKNF